jgi:hypothetical protein
VINKRLIVELRRRTLAEYSVFMTICGIGAFICAMMLAAALDRYFAGAALFSVAACFWLTLMAYLWLHFFHAARRAQLAPSSTRLFHTIQYVALAFAAIPLVLSHGSGWAILLFSAISLGVEAALSAFFICYVFLAATLCQRVPRSAFIGLAFAVVGYYFSYRHILTQ